MFDDALEEQWKSMIHAGYSEEQINLAKQRKRDKERVRVYEYMVQQHVLINEILDYNITHQTSNIKYESRCATLCMSKINFAQQLLSST